MQPSSGSTAAAAGLPNEDNVPLVTDRTSADGSLSSGNRAGTIILGSPLRKPKALVLAWRTAASGSCNRPSNAGMAGRPTSLNWLRVSAILQRKLASG